MSLPKSLNRLLGLLHPEWELRLGPHGAARRARGEAGVRLSEERVTGRVAGGTPVESAVRCSYDGAHLDKPVLVGLCALSTFREARLTAPTAQAGASLRGCDLRAVRVERADLGELSTVGSSLEDAVIEGGDLGELDLVDARHARLRAVRLRAARACDFTAASLEGCDLSSADLRGARFRRADLRNCKLEGALVDGADFGGCSGLDRATRRSLIERGARFRGASLVAIVRRLMPSAGPLKQHRVAFRVQVSAWVLAVGLALGASAMAMKPPPAPEVDPVPAALERAATAEERAQTKAELGVLRQAIQKAHDQMVANGAEHTVWPTLRDVQENRYDADGEREGEVMLSLVHGGLPKNLLTASQGGVLPYCNEKPTQETLQGVDTDWHYCELSGRVFASGGFTREPTLNW